MVSQTSERLKFLVAFRPGFVSPTLAAQMASAFQRQTGGRLLLNVVTGGEGHEQRAYGDFLDKDARYRRTGIRQAEGHAGTHDREHPQEDQQ